MLQHLLPSSPYGAGATVLLREGGGGDGVSPRLVQERKIAVHSAAGKLSSCIVSPRIFKAATLALVSGAPPPPPMPRPNRMTPTMQGTMLSRDMVMEPPPPPSSLPLRKREEEQREKLLLQHQQREASQRLHSTPSAARRVREKLAGEQRSRLAHEAHTRFMVLRNQLQKNEYLLKPSHTTASLEAARVARSRAHFGMQDRAGARAVAGGASLTPEHQEKGRWSAVERVMAHSHTRGKGETRGSGNSEATRDSRWR
jgi:hypothetical protein